LDEAATADDCVNETGQQRRGGEQEDKGHGWLSFIALTLAPTRVGNARCPPVCQIGCSAEQEHMKEQD
jgi:hypothetical protein